VVLDKVSMFELELILQLFLPLAARCLLVHLA
jgi:hypothetical protein